MFVLTCFICHCLALDSFQVHVFLVSSSCAFGRLLIGHLSCTTASLIFCFLARITSLTPVQIRSFHIYVPIKICSLGYTNSLCLVPVHSNIPILDYLSLNDNNSPLFFILFPVPNTLLL